MRTFFLLCFFVCFFTCKTAWVVLDSQDQIDLSKTYLNSSAETYTVELDEMGSFRLALFGEIEGRSCSGRLFEYTEDIHTLQGDVKEYCAFSCLTDNCKNEMVQLYFLKTTLKDVTKIGELKDKTFLLGLYCDENKYAAKIQLKLKPGVNASKHLLELNYLPDYGTDDSTGDGIIDTRAGVDDEFDNDPLNNFGIQAIEDLNKPGQHVLGNVLSNNDKYIKWCKKET